MKSVNYFRIFCKIFHTHILNCLVPSLNSIVWLLFIVIRKLFSPHRHCDVIVWMALKLMYFAIRHQLAPFYIAWTLWKCQPKSLHLFSFSDKTCLVKCLPRCWCFSIDKERKDWLFVWVLFMLKIEKRIDNFSIVFDVRKLFVFI